MSFATYSEWLQGNDAWNLGHRCLPHSSTHRPQPQIPVWLQGHTLGAGFQDRKLSPPSCLRPLPPVTVHPVDLRWTVWDRYGKLWATHMTWQERMWTLQKPAQPSHHLTASVSEFLSLPPVSGDPVSHPHFRTHAHSKTYLLCFQSNFSRS